MKRMFALTVFVTAIGGPGCSVQRPPTPAAQQPYDAAQQAYAPAAQPAHALPFKGRLLNADPHEVPPAVALSLSSDAPVTFSYREELTHDDYHPPLIVTALDPVTYFGAPLGDRGVQAFASLTISEGDKILGDYTAKAYVSKSYNLYSEPPHAELEREARAAVRERIDQKLYRDSERLAKAVAPKPAANPIAK
jgi:hypothetical protein